MINWRNFFVQPIKNDQIKNDNIWKIITVQIHDYKTGGLLDYHYFNEHYKLIATDLSKEQKIDADPKETQQISFTGNLERDWDTQIFFIIEETKEAVLSFSI